jgi:PKD repeat protein
MQPTKCRIRQVVAVTLLTHANISLMKKIHLLLVTFCVYSLSVCAQHPTGNGVSNSKWNTSGNKMGDERFENKTAFRKMLEKRTFPETSKNRYGAWMQELVEFKNSNSQQQVANWTPIDASGSLLNDVGRTSSITLDTVNAGRFYVCTPHSGVWMTTNNGNSYVPITENMPTQNTSCLVYDPLNTSTLYLATGTHNMDMPPNSMGVFKSTDTGTTWNVTGLSFSPADGHTIGDLIINPSNSNSLLAATTDGLYRTFDGGVVWNKIINDTILSVRFKPGDTTTVYAVGKRYYRSVNSGTTFTQITSGVFSSFDYSYEYFVRTTKADPNILYLFTAGVWIGSGFNTRLYVHKSIDNGLTFSVIDSLAGDACYQSDVSQITPDRIASGYRGTAFRNGSGSAYVTASIPNSSGSFPYMHADQRGILFDPFDDNIIYYCNDGGLYRSVDGALTFQNITANMELTHLYDFAVSQSDPYKIVVATLDVSPYILGNSGIATTFSNFFVEAFSTSMSPLNDDRFHLAHQTPYFTTNGGSTFYNSSHPMIGNGSYEANSIQFDECNENVCYFSSWNDIYKSDDGGASFMEFVETPYNPVNSFIRSPLAYKVCRSNPRFVYVAYTDSIYITKDGTSNFTNISAGLPVGQAAISSIAVDPVDENKIWVSFSGYSSGNKVFFSADAGQSWTNISAGLPNIPINELVCQTGVAGAIYAAADGAVFYKDNTFSNWQLYNTGLPAVIINGIEIQYNTGKLRVATFGRGVYESDLFQPTPPGYVLPPVALFQLPNTTSCIGASLTLENISCGIVDSVLWLFPGGTPAVSVDFNPVVSYATSGNYTVTLIAYNSGGSDTLTLANYISIQVPQSIPYYEPIGDLNLQILPAGCSKTDVNGDGVSWWRSFYPDGSSGPGDDFLVYDNFNWALAGLEEAFILPQIDLSTATNPMLYFYRSYNRRDQFTTDSLKIAVRACGGNDVVLYAKGGLQLANSAATYPATFWTPNLPSDWIRDSLDLTSFAGEEAVTISFINKGYSGQLLYIDDFRIMEAGTTSLQEPQHVEFSIFPNPATSKLYIRGYTARLNTIVINDLTGRAVLSKTASGFDDVVDISTLAKGCYSVSVNDTAPQLIIIN